MTKWFSVFASLVRLCNVCFTVCHPRLGRQGMRVCEWGPKLGTHVMPDRTGKCCTFLRSGCGVTSVRSSPMGWNCTAPEAVYVLHIVITIIRSHDTSVPCGRTLAFGVSLTLYWHLVQNVSAVQETAQERRCSVNGLIFMCSHLIEQKPSFPG